MTYISILFLEFLEHGKKKALGEVRAVGPVECPEAPLSEFYDSSTTFSFSRTQTSGQHERE